MAIITDSVKEKWSRLRRYLSWYADINNVTQRALDQLAQKMNTILFQEAVWALERQRRCRVHRRGGFL